MVKIYHPVDPLANGGIGGASSYDPGDANSGAEGASSMDTYLPPQKAEVFDPLKLVKTAFFGLIEWFGQRDAKPSGGAWMAMGCSGPSYRAGHSGNVPEIKPIPTPKTPATPKPISSPQEESHPPEKPTVIEGPPEEDDRESYFSEDRTYYSYDKQERHIRIFEEKTFQGIVFPKDSELWFDENGKLHEALLESAPKDKIQGIQFQGGVFLRFYESGRLKAVQIDQEQIIYGRKYPGNLELEFDEKGRILRTLKTEPDMESPIHFWIPR